MRPNPRALTHRGAALLEVVMAASLFLVVTQVFFTLTARKQESIRMAEDRTLATLVVDREVQRARTLPAAQLRALHGQTFEVPGLPTAGAPAGRWEVESDSQRPSIFRVTVSVRYTLATGESAPRVAFTALVRPGRDS